MRKRLGLSALALLFPLFFLGEEKVILNPTDRGLLPNVPVSPSDHSGDGVEYHPPFGSPVVGPMAGLSVYWNLDELTGTRAKTAGTCASCDLTAVNAPTASGGGGSHAMLNANNTLAKSSAAALGGANTSFTFSAWVRLSSTSGYAAVAGSATGGTYDWYLRYFNGASQSQCYDSTSGLVTAASPSNITAGPRYLVTLVYDQSTKKCQLYHGTTAGAASAALTNGIKSAAAPFVIGDQIDATAIPMLGAVGPAMYWGGKALSSDEITSLYNSNLGYTCSSLPTALRTSLVACWNLSEASGTRAESGIGSCGSTCDLTVLNAPSRTAGLVASGLGMSAYAVGTSSMALNLADNADISLSTTEYTVSCWANPTALADSIILDKTDEYRLGIDAANKPYAKIGDTDTATWGSAVPAGSWIMLTGGKNVAEGVWVSVNAGTRVTTPVTSEASDTANALRIFSTSAGGSYFTGTVDACGFWKRDLNAATITALYASGAGVEYPWVGVADLLSPPVQWASLPIYDRQRIIYAKTGVLVPEAFFPSRKVYVR